MLQSENKDHLSPIEARAGTELGNKDIKFFFIKLPQNSEIVLFTHIQRQVKGWLDYLKIKQISVPNWDWVGARG